MSNLVGNEVTLEEWTIQVGHVVKPHGLQGELSVIVLSDAPERFEPGSELCVVTQRGGRWLTEVEDTRAHKGRLLVLLAGCESRDDAEALRGAQLTIPPSRRASLPEGAYYEDELIGMTVTTTAGETIGLLREVLRTGSNDVYVTDRVLIPATREVVKQVDVTAKTMVIEPVPGLLD